MRALRIEGARPSVIDRPEPSPAPGEAVIRLTLAGICGTDLEIARGYMGFSGVPGHEFVGRVERTPDPAWTGRRVVGDGRLAQLCARVLARAGAPPLLVGRHPRKLALAAAAGIRTTDRPDEIPRDFDFVVEATGSPSGFEVALRLVRPRGTIVLKSTYHSAAPIALTPVVIDEISIVGSRCGPFAPALAHLAADARAFAPLVTARYALEDAAEAFARASSSDAMKVLLAP